MKIIAYHASHAAPKTRRRRRRNFRPLIVLLLLLFIFLGIGFGINQLLHRAEDKKPSYDVTEIRGLPVYQHFLEKEAVGRIGGKREVQYIVIHETNHVQRGPMQHRHDAFIHQNAMQEKLSWHYTVTTMRDISIFRIPSLPIMQEMACSPMEAIPMGLVLNFALHRTMIMNEF